MTPAPGSAQRPAGGGAPRPQATVSPSPAAGVPVRTRRLSARALAEVVGGTILGDPTRVRILYALAEVGELCVCDIAAVVDAPETSVSHALRLLRASGVVRNRKSGRMVYYSLDDVHVRMLLDVSAEHLRHDPASSR